MAGKSRFPENVFLTRNGSKGEEWWNVTDTLSAAFDGADDSSKEVLVGCYTLVKRLKITRELKVEDLNG